ncbi:MAG: radical SAM protein [Desulfatitalea sp.]|nr:radical SAM protein [Desulfatitalea sp.]NNK01039.1 radical SAM protein [Desulfatitalea sp.]
MGIRYLIIMLTTRCNLRCSYCYNADNGPPMDMSAAVLRRALDLGAAGGVPFHLQLTGGEPTLAPELIETALSMARDNASCRGVGVQTNATCLTPHLIDLVRCHRVQVGGSLDGPPDIQERQRGMAAETLRGLKRLEAGGIPFRVTAVVTQAAAALDRLVLMLAGFSMARGIGLDLLVNKGRARDSGHVAAADPKSLQNGLGRMHAALQMVNEHRSPPMRWREWDLVFPPDGQVARHTAFCRAALNQSVAVTPDGRLFPCGQTCHDERFAAGTVWTPEIERRRRLPACRPPQAPCGDCEASAACPGDCPSRLFHNPYPQSRLACHMYRALYRMGNPNQGGIQS